MEEDAVKKMLEAKFKALTDELADQREAGASKDELIKLTSAVETQGLELKRFMDVYENNKKTTFTEKFVDFVHENKDKIKEIYNAKTGEVVFDPYKDKAPEDITTGSGSDEEVPPVHRGTNLGHFNFRNDNSLLNLCTVTSTSTPSASYTEMIPKDGDYSFVNEGAEKPQIDFKWENRYPVPKKIAAYEILTEEAVTDYKKLTSVAKEYLSKKHDLFKANAIFFAAGTGDLPTGATVYGRTFVAGGMAGQFASGTSNIMDVINACITDVYTTQNFADEAHYSPNVVLISPVDFFLSFQAAKDANGLSLYPQASLFNKVNIGGVTIVPWVKIPVGKIFVADMKLYNIVNYVPFSIRIGWINDQFITNKFTMLGESRFFQYVKNLDQNAFIYDDIATVKTAIEA